MKNYYLCLALCFSVGVAKGEVVHSAECWLQACEPNPVQVDVYIGGNTPASACVEYDLWISQGDVELVGSRELEAVDELMEQGGRVVLQGVNQGAERDAVRVHLQAGESALVQGVLRDCSDTYYEGFVLEPFHLTRVIPDANGTLRIPVGDDHFLYFSLLRLP